ncbi:MAG: Trk system potassium transporter TrkA [Firmicutes bacterium]|nr:Trk system potassium transporter TrkA [Bacillota bacterium]
MKIVIVGDGKVGQTLIRQLSKEGHDLTVVDSNPKILNNNIENFDILTVEGNGASMETLRRADAGTADLVIAATSTDEINLLCCITAKKLGAKHTIARVRNTEYREQLVALRQELGLSMTINPEYAAAREIYQILQLPNFVKRETFAKGRVEIVEMRVDEKSPLRNLPLHQLPSAVGFNILVAAVLREDQVTIPSGNFVLQEGDHVFFAAKTAHLMLLLKHLGLSPQRIRHVMIIGGGRIARHLIPRLLEARIDVKVLEKDHDRCLQLYSEFPQISVVEGDGSLQQILESEGIHQTDAIITLTNIDEENLIISMFANHCGVRKIVTKIGRLEYGNLFSDMGIGSIISPKERCSADIVRYVRAMQNAEGSEIVALYHIANDLAEAMEFRVDDTVRYQGVPLKDIPLRENILIACVTHDNEPVLANGSTTFREGDAVVVVSAGQHMISHLNDIYAE